ncbi:hypothetical protein [Rhizobium anhuiense]|uniref:Uncharacterized protein n=1 Tax=Rhizobium anhuiense TaxID=1184720 RepID=A0A432N9B9_9HYPH|nr:hypothetical protein [Rhizobium anhuiense]RUL96142.1 hypothetical protein EEQ99_32300 [Rhizobium anhuiense]GGE10615.1 hypothetical protein GCM10008012_61640 [Rhizobium anhuiense]
MPERILKLEFRQILGETKSGEDRTAFFPTMFTHEDRDGRRAAAFEYFQRSAKFAGADVEGLDGFGEDAVIYTDPRGRRSLWVEAEFPAYKRAYIAYWNTLGGLSDLVFIDGARYHVDHSFNKARMIVEHGDGTIVDDGTIPLLPPHVRGGYVRLFLVPAVVNVAWGRTIEKRRSGEGRLQGLFRAASWIILAKLAGHLPPSRDDLESAAKRLIAVYGRQGFKGDDDVTRSYCHELRLNSGHTLKQLLTPDGVANAFLRDDDIIRDPEIVALLDVGLKLGVQYPLFDAAIPSAY